MSKCYRSIWNEALGSWVAAPETAKAKGKPGRTRVASVLAAVAMLGGSAAMADDNICPHDISSALTGNCTVSAGSTVNIESGGSISDGAVYVDNGGTLNIAAGASVTNTGQFEIVPDVWPNPGGNNAYGGLLLATDANLDNAGTVTRLQGTGGTRSFVGLLGGTHTITNEGTLEDKSGSDSIIRLFDNNTTLELTNSGSIIGDKNDSGVYTAVPNTAIYINNEAGSVFDMMSRGIVAWINASQVSLSIDNAGTMQSGSNQTIYFNSSGGSGVVDNTGTIESASGDAILTTGSEASFSVDNDGTIKTDKVGGTAIQFKSAKDTLTLEGSSVIVGKVISDGGSLTLGGDSNGSFDISQVGSTQQYQNFGSFDKTGASTWTLTGDNSATQAQSWNLESGALALSDANLTGGISTDANTTGPITVTLDHSNVNGSIDLSNDGDSTVQVDNSNGTSAVSGGVHFSGSGSKTVDFTGSGSSEESDGLDSFDGVTAFAKDGSGTWALTAASTQSANWSVNEGTLGIGNDSALGSGTVTLNGGTLGYEDGIVLANTLQVAKDSGVAIASGTAQQQGTISGALHTTLSKSGDGTLEIVGDNADMHGNWALNGGTLQVDSSDGLGDGALTLAGGTLVLNADITLDNTMVVDQASTLAVASGSDTLDGALSGSGDFTKTGDGTLTLNGDGSGYAGALSIGGGTVNADGALSAASVAVASGAVLNANNTLTSTVTVGGVLGGSGTVHGDVTIDNGGHLTQNAGAALKGLTIDGTLTMNGGASLDYNLDSGTLPGQEHALQVNGNLDFEGTVKLNVDGLVGTGAPDEKGYYSVIDYSGTVTNGSDFQLGNIPAGQTNDYTLNNVANAGGGGEYQLGYETSDASMHYWDGGTTTADGSIHGGDGVWNDDAANTNWTDSAGQINAASAAADSDNGNMIFGSGGGTVDVEGNHQFDSLQFISDGYTLNGSGTLELAAGNGNEVRVLDGYTATIDTQISGAGALDKTEGGTLVLTGDNTYSGGTNLDGGVVQVSADDNLGAASGGLNFDGGTLQTTQTMTTARDAEFGKAGGGLDVDSGTTLTMSGTLSGDGSMVKEGDGTLVLSGDNSYSGGSVLMGGTTQISGNDNLGSGAVVINGGTLESTADATLNNEVALGDKASAGGIDVDSGTTLTLTGEVGGDALVKNGDGTLVLTGNNVYSGGTQLNAGTLELGNSGAAGSGTISADGGALSLDDGVKAGNDIVLEQTLDTSVGAADATALEYGTISGAGGLDKSGDGTLVLVGDNTYSGGTTISGGMLVAGNDQAFGTGAVTVDSGGIGYLDGVNLTNTLVLSGANTTLNVAAGDDAGDDVAEQSGAISGSGGVTKTGDGTLILGGDNTYSGDTVVQAGALVVDGSAADSHFYLDSGASLSGDGTIGALDTHGAISPGGDDGIATLHVDNSLTMYGDSTYNVNLGADGQSDQIQVGGSADIEGASLNITAASGEYQMHTTYDILTANGGVTGQFDSTTVNLPFLTPSVSEDANNVYLTLSRNETAYDSYGDNQNERNVGEALDQMQAAVGENGLLDAVDALTAADVPHAYEQLSAESYASLQSAVATSAQDFASSVWDRMGTPSSGDAVAGNYQARDSGSDVWVSLPMAQQRVEGNANISGFTNQTWGINLGADTNLTSKLRVGVAGSYLSTTQQNDTLNSSGTVNTGNLSVYGQYDQGAWWLGGLAGLGVGTLSDQRSVDFPGYSITANGSAPVASAFAQLGGGYRIATRVGTIEPLLNVNLTATRIGDLTETGGGNADLHVAGSTQSTVSSEVGARYTHHFMLSSGAPGAFRATLGWEHQLQTPANTVMAGFVTGPTTMLAYQGWQGPKDSALVGVELSLGLSKASNLLVNYQGELGGGQTTNLVMGEYQYHW
jgi:autotransporter-associated beta strand protein